MAKGLNMQSVKNENRTSILYLLNSSGALSRKELASKLVLTPAAVTKICTSLIEKGYIREIGEISEQKRTGRREILLSLCLDDKLAFGINAEKDALTFSLTTLSGKLKKKKRLPFLSEIDDVIKEGKEFLKSLDSTENIIGTGVCIIGSLDEDDFGIWKEKNLNDIFEKAFSLPVVIENNVKAFAESELLYGSVKNSSAVLFLKWGPGIGSSIVANGKVFSGNDSSVAEIGHYIVNREGAKCRCGRYGCLETEADENAFQRELGSNLPLDELLDLGDNRIINILDKKIDMVALALTNTATILNANSIVLFGTMFNKEYITQKLINRCIRYNENLSDDMINTSSLNLKSDFIGSCAICAKRFFFESEE